MKEPNSDVGNQCNKFEVRRIQNYGLQILGHMPSLTDKFEQFCHTDEILTGKEEKKWESNDLVIIIVQMQQSIICLHTTEG